MDISFTRLASIGVTPIQQTMLDVIKGVLAYPASVEARAANLSQNIVFFCKDVDPEVHTGVAFIALWDGLLNLVNEVPPGHEWQEILVTAIDNIRQREGLACEETEDYNSFSWSELPDLCDQLVEHWQLSPVHDNEAEPEALVWWQNWNSFVSHIVGRGYTTTLYLSFWAIRDALEEPVVKGPLLDCRVWVASEWIYNCNGLIRQYLASEELTQGSREHTGPLAENISPRSLQRWDFWRKRLTELVDSENIQGVAKEWASEALKKMD